MTMEDTTCRTSVVGGAVAGQEVSFDFPVALTADLLVILRTTATGFEETLDENVDYTVDLESTAGGTVTMVAAVPATKEIHVIRQTPLKQGTDLVQGGAFNAANVEAALDKVTMQNVDQQNLYNRTIHKAITDDTVVSLELPNALERATTYLSFDATGALICTNVLTTGTASISNYGATLIDDANAAAAWTTLGFSSDVQSLLGDSSMGEILTDLGFSAFVQTLIDDLTAAEAKATLELNEYDPNSVVVERINGYVVSSRLNGNMLTIR